MSNQLAQQTAAQPRTSALALMGSRLNCDPTKLHQTLKDTVFKGATDSELLALVVVANEYGLSLGQVAAAIDASYRFNEGGRTKSLEQILEEMKEPQCIAA